MEAQDSKIQEMQLLEQNLQNLLLQKQAFNMELNETKASLKELESAEDEIFKIVGQLMIKTEKKKVLEELEKKEKFLVLRMESIAKQEELLTKNLSQLREELTKSLKK